MSMDTAVLSQLWQGCLAESVPASQRWVLAAMQHHGPGLVTMLWRVLGDEHDVCDVYQETFLHLANHFADHPRPGNLKAYMYRSAMNIAVSMLRRRRLERQYLQRTAQQPQPECIDNDFVRQFDARELQQLLRKAIARLPEYLADVVVLRDLAELSYEETASILGISRTAARVYRHKAITLLASFMNRKDS